MAAAGTYVGTVENLFASGLIANYAWFYLVGTLDGTPFEGWLQIDATVASADVSNMLTIATGARHARTPVTAVILSDPPGTVDYVVGADRIQGEVDTLMSSPVKPNPLMNLESAMKGRKVVKAPETPTPYDLKKLAEGKPDEKLRKLKELKAKYSK